MAKAKVNYDHFVKKDLKVGDTVKLIEEVNGMAKGTKGVIVDKKVMADGGAHHVEITEGPKHSKTPVYILARDLEKA